MRNLPGDPGGCRNGRRSTTPGRDAVQAEERVTSAQGDLGESVGRQNCTDRITFSTPTPRLPTGPSTVQHDPKQRAARRASSRPTSLAANNRAARPSSVGHTFSRGLRRQRAAGEEHAKHQAPTARRLITVFPHSVSRINSAISLNSAGGRWQRRVRSSTVESASLFCCTPAR